MAVALSEVEGMHRTGILTQLIQAKAQSRRKQRIKLQKFFGKCLMPDGSITILVSKAVSVAEASKKLHSGYTIDVVLDILTEGQMPREWAKIKPSLIQRSQLR